MLRDAHLDAIYVSDLKRTQQTAQFVANKQNLVLQKKTAAAELAAAIRTRTAGAVLVVGHSNTIPKTISLLGGPAYEIRETEFNNLFILTISQGQTSAVRLRYGAGSLDAVALGQSGRTTIVQISFVKSGGFAGPMTRVQGTINLKDETPKITGDAAYHRDLASGETAMLRAGAEPALLSEAANTIAAAQASGKGMGDVEHYTVTVKNSDGQTHEMNFNTSGSAGEMAGVNPAAAKLLSWIQQEAQHIFAQKMKSK